MHATGGTKGQRPTPHAKYKFKSSIKSAKTYTEANNKSAHNPLMVQLKLKFKKFKKPLKKCLQLCCKME